MPTSSARSCVIVRMVYDRHALESGPGARSTRAVAPELGVGEEPLRSWLQPLRPRRDRPVRRNRSRRRIMRLRSEVTDMRRCRTDLEEGIGILSAQPIAPRRNDPVHRYAP